MHRIVVPAAVALLSLWSSISISPATTPSLASTRWIASSVAPRRALASMPSLHLRANPLAPVQNVTGQLIAILSQPSPGSIVTIVRRDDGMNVVGRCRPTGTRCSVTWASATNGTAHLEAYWSLSTRVRPVVVRLTLQVHPAGALIYAVQQGHRLGPLVRVLAPLTPAQLAGAHSAGGASLSASRTVPGLCASGRKVLLYRDVATVPGEVVLVAPSSGPRCPPATWITPQEPIIAPSQTRAGKAGDPIALAGSFPAAPAAPAAALFFAGPRPIGSAPIQGWTLHRLRTRIGFALTPGRYSVRVGWYDPLTGRKALSAIGAAVRVTAPLPVVVSPRTRVLTAASDASLRRIVQSPGTGPSGTWTLVFVHPTTQVRALKLGDVLNSGPAPSLPHGMLRKVTGVVVNGDTIDIATSPATFSDAFTQGAIHLDIPLQPFTPTGTALAPHTLTMPFQGTHEAAYPTDASGGDLKTMSKNGFCLQAEVSVPLVRSRDELVSWPGASATLAVNGKTFNVSTPPQAESAGEHTSREVALKASATGCLTNAHFQDDIVLIPGHVTTGQWDLSLCYNDQADCPAVIQIGYPNGIVGPTPVGSKSILGDWRSEGEVSVEAGRTGHADLSVIHHVPSSIAGHQWELFQQEFGGYWAVIGGVWVEATPYLDWTLNVAGDASIAASMKVENRAHIQWGVTCVQQAGQQCYPTYSPPVVAEPVPSQPEPRGLGQERPAFDATVSSKLSVATGPNLGLKFYDNPLSSPISADVGAQFGATLSYKDEKVGGGEHTITIAADADLSLKGGIHPLANEDWGLVSFEFPLRHWRIFSHTFHVREELQSCPKSWHCTDLGNLSAAGGQVVNGGTWTMVAGPAGPAPGDQAHIAWQVLHGDGSVSARIQAISGKDSAAAAGIAIRASLATNAPWYWVGEVWNNGQPSLGVDCRGCQGGASQMSFSLPFPAYVGIGRVGNAFSAYYSSDGKTWGRVARFGASERIITMGDAPLAGLDVRSNSAASGTSATFDHVAVSGPRVQSIPLEIFNNWNPDGVADGPTRPTVFTVNTSYQLEEIVNYHFPRGPAMGTIAVKAANGKIYGPWKVTVFNGINNTPSWWAAQFHAVIPAGTYQVIDSSLSSWSYDGASGGEGFSDVWGSPAGPGGAAYVPIGGD